MGALAAVLIALLLIRAALVSADVSSQPAPQAVVDAQPMVQEPAPVTPPVPQIRFESRPLQPSYSVIAGDTLSAIAQRFSTTTDSLRGINNLAEDAILSLGQRLIIP